MDNRCEVARFDFWTELFGRIDAQCERADVRHDQIVDGLIVGVAAAVLLWVFFIGPAVLDGEVGLAERVINTAYPAGDLLLIAMGAQLAMRLRRSAPAWRAGWRTWRSARTTPPARRSTTSSGSCRVPDPARSAPTDE